MFEDGTPSEKTSAAATLLANAGDTMPLTGLVNYMPQATRVWDAVAHPMRARRAMVSYLAVLADHVTVGSDASSIYHVEVRDRAQEILLATYDAYLHEHDTDVRVGIVALISGLLDIFHYRRPDEYTTTHRGDHVTYGKMREVLDDDALERVPSVILERMVRLKVWVDAHP